MNKRNGSDMNQHSSYAVKKTTEYEIVKLLNNKLVRTLQLLRKLAIVSTLCSGKNMYFCFLAYLLEKNNQFE